MSDTQSPLESLIDHVVSGAEKSVPGLVGGWLDRVLATGQQKVDDLDPSLRGVARVALEQLAKHKDELAGVSQGALVAIVSKLALGKGAEAQRVYLATQASFDEQSAVLDADSDATQGEVADRSAAWFKVKSVAEELLLSLGKAAVPLILAL